MSEYNFFKELWNGWRRWLRLGIGIKRWLVILGVGAVIAGAGVSAFILALGDWKLLPETVYILVTLQFLPVGLRIILPLAVGGWIIYTAIRRFAYNLVAPFRRPDERISDSLYAYTQRNRGPRIVAIGGGTGMPSLLRGLREYTSNITAVVTVADDGGSSGRLRKELGVLPPGDFRNNIAALSRDEALMTQLMQYRFGGGVGDNGHQGERGELQGHAFGNLLLVALMGITGSFDEALIAAGRVLAIRGQVLPSTLENVTLTAEIEIEGSKEIKRVVGESFIPKAGGRIKQVQLEPARIPAYPPVVQAILHADLVVIGPGSLYTSILPNLLVQDIAEALQQTKAYRVYICNLATQPGETDNYTVADHVAAINNHVTLGKVNDRGLFD
ncbi:MAG: gluconeogenesis factor YvcK family protein, partial [Candidatus Promineifilaceae bacterium]